MTERRSYGWLCRGMAGLLLLLATATPVPAQTAPHVFVNAERVAPAQLRAFERQYRVRVAPGRYWYDRVSGAWGIEGGAGGADPYQGIAVW